jgi:hypothetical protein
LENKIPDIEDADYLGDEWREAGAMAGFEVAIDQGPGLFLAAVGVFVVAAGALFAALWYLTAPRLAALTPVLPDVLLAAGSLLLLYIVFEYLALIATVYTGKGLALPLARSSGAVVKLLPAARRLARLFGSTPDRMAHSAVRVSNAVTRAVGRRPGGRGPVLVLLPRCVQRPGCTQPLVEDIENCRRCGKCPVAGLLDLRNEYPDVVMAVLTGGSVVPGVVRRLEPRAVIGLACERELISGIMAVNGRPVLGVANQRPLGPCRGTTLDVAELRDAIEIFAERREEAGE